MVREDVVVLWQEDASEDVGVLVNDRLLKLLRANEGLLEL
jgi:hypothetical protein